MAVVSRSKNYILATNSPEGARMSVAAGDAGKAHGLDGWVENLAKMRIRDA